MARKTAAAAARAEAPAAEIMVNLFDGTRRPMAFESGGQALLTIRDGNQRTLHRDFHTEPSVLFQHLPVFQNFGDNYAVLAAVDGFDQAGFVPVHVAANVLRTVDLMLIRRDAGYDFSEARWDRIDAGWVKLMAAGAAADAAQTRYTDLMEQRPNSLACLLNLFTAMSQIHLPQGSPLDYLRELIWDRTMAQDRFFAWADPSLVDQVRRAALDGEFAPEHDPGLFHPGATSSFKQVRFGEANVQLTFHENTLHNGWIQVEPDIDYFKDPAAHALLEVLANGLTGSLTDPRVVYVLRWIAGRHAGVAEFDPPYRLV